MRTRAFFWSVVFSCLFAVSFACGDGGDGDDKPAGQAGAGGDGGSGGTGGTGGGGPDPFCGDGMVNQASEECDDGNEFSNDGCSSDCKIEGTCAQPFVYRQVARYDSTLNFRTIIPLNLDWVRTGNERNSCSFESDAPRSIVFRYDNDEDTPAYLRVSNFTYLPGAELYFTLAVRRTCEDPASEDHCQAGFVMEDTFFVSDRIYVPANESIYLIAEFHDILFGEDIPEEFQVGMGVTTMKVLEEGDACSMNPREGAWCLPGLACGEAGICEVDEPPVVTDAKVYYDDEESRLVVLASGSDQPGNAQWMHVVFRTEAGTEVEFDRYDEIILEYISAQVPKSIIPEPPISGMTEFDVEWEVRNPPVTSGSVDIAFWDLTYDPDDLNPPGTESGKLGEVMNVPIEPMPTLGEGELCDTKRRYNRCATGLTCKLDKDGDLRNRCLP